MASSSQGYIKNNLLERLSARETFKSLVEEWWEENGWGKAPLPNLSNVGLIARPIATFRYEDALFVTLCERHGLTPVWSEYTGDKLSTVSNVKRSLLHVNLCSGRGKKNGLQLNRVERLANVNHWIGKPLNTIRTIHGSSLVDFHHQHQDRVFSFENAALRFDWTLWLKQIGSAKDYYEAYLSAFIAHAILFEDYHAGESGAVLDNFSAGVFEPAWQAVSKRFGVPPLITPLPWHEDYRYYPADEHWREHGVLRQEHLQ